MFDSSWSSLPLGAIAARIAVIRHPEELFGPMAGLMGARCADAASQLRRLQVTYHQLALCVHPDRHAGDPRATVAFAAVQRLYEQARQEIVSGAAGAGCGAIADGQPAVSILSRRWQYTVGWILAEGEIAVLYEATAHAANSAPLAPAPATPVILKVARDPADNGLLANEASALRILLHPDATSRSAASSPTSGSGAPVPPYIPRLLESFICEDGSGVARAAQAFPTVTTAAGALDPRDFFTLSELRAAYPAGLDARHIGWIWRRLLIALEHAHVRGVIHSAVLPEHVLIHPADHGLLLVDWCASVQLTRVPDGHITVVSPDYEAWYPVAALAGHTPTPAVDLLMGLRCMVYLLGGEPRSGALPASVPGPLQAYLRGALAAVWAGHTDASQLYQDFSTLLASIWGQRRFVPLSMPARETGATVGAAGARRQHARHAHTR